MLTIEIGKGRTIAVTPEQLATMDGFAVVKNKVWHRALKEMLSDANAGIGARDAKNADGSPMFTSDKEYGDAAYAASMKLFEALLNGEVRGANRKPRESSDPVTAEAQRMARVKINGLARGWEKGDVAAIANIVAWAEKLGLPYVTIDEQKAVIAAAIAANAARADVREAAEKAVAAKAKVIAKVDVDDLL